MPKKDQTQKRKIVDDKQKPVPAAHQQQGTPYWVRQRDNTLYSACGYTDYSFPYRRGN